MTTGPQTTAIQVQTERMATGGEAVARLDDGRVVFVRGALEGEVVQVELTEQKKRFARGVVTQVITPSAHRIEPTCVHTVSGECGGCDWMHVAAPTQLTYKHNIVSEQLQRLGGIDQPCVATADTPRGQRTTVRCSVIRGRAGYRTRKSDTSFVATECGAAHRLLEELIVGGHFANATEVTLRVAPSTGQRMVITNGDPQSMQLPADVLAVSAEAPGDAAIYEELAGQRWRISAKSFFQTSFVGAEALIAAVTRSLAGADGDLVDLYAGVGLVGGAAAPGQLRCAVESNPSSISDAKHNLGPAVDVVQSRVEQWKPTTFATVIADPARRGLGAPGARVIEQTGATRLVLVSCDPASLGRDTALLKEQGWSHDQSEVIDMFPDTSRIEVVTSFTR